MFQDNFIVVVFQTFLMCGSCFPSCFFIFQEGLRFFIYFKDHHEYELEADTLEEKEKVSYFFSI